MTIGDIPESVRNFTPNKKLVSRCFLLQMTICHMILFRWEFANRHSHPLMVEARYSAVARGLGGALHWEKALALLPEMHSLGSIPDGVGLGPRKN